MFGFGIADCGSPLSVMSFYRGYCLLRANISFDSRIINMKKINRLAFFGIVGLAVLAFSSGVRAQDHSQDHPIVGGYGTISVRSAEAQGAAKFAVAARARRTGKRIVLWKVLKAEQQVVAGMNYRVCMRVFENGKARTVTAVVYKNLRNKRSLTSWANSRCG